MKKWLVHRRCFLSFMILVDWLKSFVLHRSDSGIGIGEMISGVVCPNLTDLSLILHMINPEGFVFIRSCDYFYLMSSSQYCLICESVEKFDVKD